MSAAAREVAQALKTQSTIVDGDLVVTGKYGRCPATVRFSSSPDKPPLVIQMEIPLLAWLDAGKFTSGQQAYFSFSMVPRDSVVKERGSIMTTNNQTLDSRFIVRSDNPSGAKTFVQTKASHEELQKLCCSPKTSLRINGVNMEVTEMGGGQNGRHILAHLESMAKLTGATPPAPSRQTQTGMTGGFKLPTTVTLPSVSMPKALGGRAPLIVAAVVALALVTVAGWKYLSVDEEQPAGVPAGMSAADAALIAGVEYWQMAEDKDLNAAGLDWMRRQGVTPSSRVSGDFAGGGSADVVYVLKRRGGMLRVVLISKGKNYYDTNFSPLALVARLPKAALEGIQWTDKVPGAPEGDGLLIVRNPDDLNTAIIVMFSGGKVITGRPPNYRDLKLQ